MNHRHFPHELYLVHHLPTNSYGCVYADGDRGLACFTRAAAASRFAGCMETQQNLIVAVTMADACEIASQTDLSMLVLADSPSALSIHDLGSHKSRS